MSEKQQLAPFIRLLKEGDVVAFPTETVYGLGADARNPSAIRRIFEIKGRPSDNPLIVHVSSLKMATDFACEISGDARKLAEAFWPGPLTLVFRKQQKVLDLITAGMDTVAVRMPGHEVALQLIREAGALVAPSANKSGGPSPTHAQHVRDDFGEDFPILDAGKCKIGLESTVLNISEEPYEILRPGYIGKKEIEKVLGKTIREYNPDTDLIKPRSPGMKYSHYAPETSVRWLKAGEQPDHEETLYLLHQKDWTTDHPNVIHFRGDYNRFARELYDRFRQADSQGYKEICIEPLTGELLSENEIGQALYNRISKAIGKNEDG